MPVLSLHEKAGRLVYLEAIAGEIAVKTKN
jgi:hypothetical protein